ncbi:MAG: DNA recombination protein RmuC [Chloroflexota bacterium]
MELFLIGVLVLLSMGIVVLALVVVRRSGLAAKVDTSVQVELTRLAERISTMEKGQSAASQSLVSLGTALAELQTLAKARQDVEQRTAGAIQRLEVLMTGAPGKGAVGENMLEAALATLPAEWQVRDFKVGNKMVEFGLCLPNGLVLPIDSKWPATALLEELYSAGDAGKNAALRFAIEDAVVAKAKDVRKYLEPSRTTDFGLAVVPDSIYAHCGGILTRVYQEYSVIVLGHSMLVPYLLLVFQTVLKTSQAIDLERLGVYLKTAQDSFKALQEELEGRLSKVIIMLDNSRSYMRARLGEVNTGLTGLRASASASLPGTVEPPTDKTS